MLQECASSSGSVVEEEDEFDVEGASPWSPPLVPSSPVFVPAAADATEEAEKLLPWQLLLQQRGWKNAEVEGVEAAAAAAAAAVEDDEEEEDAVEWLRSPPLDASDACSNAEDAADATLEATAERKVLLERAAAVAASILNSRGNWNSAIEKDSRPYFSPFVAKTTARCFECWSSQAVDLAL